MKLDPVKGIKCYMDAAFAGGCNQEEGKDHGSFLSRTGYLFLYNNCPIKWASQIQTEISLSTEEAEYISLSQYMREVLPFVSLMKEIEFVLKILGDTLTVQCSIFENLVIFHEGYQR